MATEQTDTIVGVNVELKGSLHNQGPIQVYGKVTGDISSDAHILIGETAVVHGPVTAKTIDVAGQVIGSITGSEQIELQPKSLVKGDLSTGRLSIKPGATFIGKSQMSGEGFTHEALPENDKKKPRLEVD